MHGQKGGHVVDEGRLHFIHQGPRTSGLMFVLE